MASLFKSTSQARHYANFRPVYPPSLYDKIASSVVPTGNETLAIDVGCGPGQATVALAAYFDKIVGIDPSQAQLQNAATHDRVSYQVGQATKLPAQNGTVAAVTAAQAAHWFDIPTFHQEVDRVLQPGGCLAMWTYGNVEFQDDPKLQAMVTQTLYEETLGQGGYWDDRRLLVENKYRDIPVLSDKYPGSYVGERIYTGHDIEGDMGKAQLIGYLRSWSGYVTYCQRNGIEQESPDDPIEPIRRYLESEMRYESDAIPVFFPVTMLLSVKTGRSGKDEL